MNSLSTVLFALLFAGIAGAILPTQAVINSALAKSGGGPLWAAFISFFSGTVLLLVILLSTKQNLPSVYHLSELEWWNFAGGFLGVFYVAIGIIFVPVIGSSQFALMVISGQIAASIAIEHYGLLGFTKQSATWQTFIGVALLLVGIILIKK